MAEENTDIFSIVESVKDETKKKELKTTDEEEDFMDEGNDKCGMCSLCLCGLKIRQQRVWILRLRGLMFVVLC
jgi:hypothetical protein